eukprot:3906868-Amphidinium_carterae.1
MSWDRSGLSWNWWDEGSSPSGRASRAPAESGEFPPLPLPPALRPHLQSVVEVVGRASKGQVRGPA